MIYLLCMLGAGALLIIACCAISEAIADHRDAVYWRGAAEWAEAVRRLEPECATCGFPDLRPGTEHAPWCRDGVHVATSRPYLRPYDYATEPETPSPGTV